MKIRTGFVSNSSSSSFIIHKRSLTTKQLIQLKRRLNELDRLELGFWDRSEKTWYESKNIIYIRCGYVIFDILDIFNDVKLSDDQWEESHL